MDVSRITEIKSKITNNIILPWIFPNKCNQYRNLLEICKKDKNADCKHILDKLKEYYCR